jgi:hypothetical protein
VAVRDRNGSPVVIKNAPWLDDGTPMPTSYWLVGEAERDAVSRLESRGGVKAAEAAVDPDALADAHVRYARARDRAANEQSHRAPPGESSGGASGERPRPRPRGGVGGTRQGVKCLHAHLAWYLSGSDDPVGAWTASELGLDRTGYRHE